MADMIGSLTGRSRARRGLRALDPEGGMWLAHDRPSTPLAYGAWLCDCCVCTERARADAGTDPWLPVMLKHRSGRALVTLAEYVTNGPAALADELFADTVLIEDGEVLPPSAGLREVFVADPEARGAWGRIRPARGGRGSGGPTPRRPWRPDQ